MDCTSDIIGLIVQSLVLQDQDHHQDQVQDRQAPFVSHNVGLCGVPTVTSQCLIDVFYKDVPSNVQDDMF